MPAEFSAEVNQMSKSVSQMSYKRAIKGLIWRGQKESDLVLEAIDVISRRKSRPNLIRIYRHVNRSYGLTFATCERILEELVSEAKVVRVLYKGNISFRNARTWKKYPGYLKKKSMKMDRELSGSLLTNVISELVVKEPDYLNTGVPYRDIENHLLSLHDDVINKKSIRKLVERELSLKSLQQYENGNYFFRSDSETIDLPKFENEIDSGPSGQNSPSSESINNSELIEEIPSSQASEDDTLNFSKYNNIKNSEDCISFLMKDIFDDSEPLGSVDSTVKNKTPEKTEDSDQPANIENSQLITINSHIKNCSQTSLEPKETLEENRKCLSSDDAMRQTESNTSDVLFSLNIPQTKDTDQPVINDNSQLITINSHIQTNCSHTSFEPDKTLGENRECSSPDDAVRQTESNNSDALFSLNSPLQTKDNDFNDKQSKNRATPWKRYQSNGEDSNGCSPTFKKFNSLPSVPKNQSDADIADDSNDSSPTFKNFNSIPRVQKNQNVGEMADDSRSCSSSTKMSVGTDEDLKELWTPSKDGDSNDGENEKPAVNSLVLERQKRKTKIKFDADYYFPELVRRYRKKQKSSTTKPPDKLKKKMKLENSANEDGIDEEIININERLNSTNTLPQKKKKTESGKQSRCSIGVQCAFDDSFEENSNSESLKLVLDEPDKTFNEEKKTFIPVKEDTIDCREETTTCNECKKMFPKTVTPSGSNSSYFREENEGVMSYCRTCLKNKTKEACKLCKNTDSPLCECGVCKERYHIYCHIPKIELPMPFDWTCSDCRPVEEKADDSEDAEEITPYEYEMYTLAGDKFFKSDCPVIKNWSAADVAAYFRKFFNQDVAQLFVDDDIDGYSLKLMERADVLGMKCPLGTRYKILLHVRRLQLCTNNLFAIWNC